MLAVVANLEGPAGEDIDPPVPPPLASSNDPGLAIEAIEDMSLEYAWISAEGYLPQEGRRERT